MLNKEMMRQQVVSVVAATDHASVHSVSKCASVVLNGGSIGPSRHRMSESGITHENDLHINQPRVMQLALKLIALSLQQSGFFRL